MKRRCHFGRVKYGPRKGRCRKHRVSRRRGFRAINSGSGRTLLAKAARRCVGTGRQFKSCVRGTVKMLKHLG